MKRTNVAPVALQQYLTNLESRKGITIFRREGTYFKDKNTRLDADTIVLVDEFQEAHGYSDHFMEASLYFGFLKLRSGQIVLKDKPLKAYGPEVVALLLGLGRKMDERQHTNPMIPDGPKPLRILYEMGSLYYSNILLDPAFPIVVTYFNGHSSTSIAEMMWSDFGNWQ